MEIAPLTTPYNARTLQFKVNSMYGYKAGLQYFDVTGAVTRRNMYNYCAVSLESQC
jgi:hypothetical protein